MKKNKIQNNSLNNSKLEIETFLIDLETVKDKIINKKEKKGLIYFFEKVFFSYQAKLISECNILCILGVIFTRIVILFFIYYLLSIIL